MRVYPGRKQDRRKAKGLDRLSCWSEGAFAEPSAAPGQSRHWLCTARRGTCHAWLSPSCCPHLVPDLFARPTSSCEPPPDSLSCRRRGGWGYQGGRDETGRPRNNADVPAQTSLGPTPAASYSVPTRGQAGAPPTPEPLQGCLRDQAGGERECHRQG